MNSEMMPVLPSGLAFEHGDQSAALARLLWAKPEVE
jgi:hypothetical protein